MCCYSFLYISIVQHCRVSVSLCGLATKGNTVPVYHHLSFSLFVFFVLLVFFVLTTEYFGEYVKHRYKWLPKCMVEKDSFLLLGS
jgi:hypothetical protein